jgi:hypothetical protein
LIFGGLIHFSFAQASEGDELTDDVYLMTVQTDGGNSIKKLPSKLGAKDRIYFNQTFALDV